MSFPISAVRGGTIPASHAGRVNASQSDAPSGPDPTDAYEAGKKAEAAKKREKSINNLPRDLMIMEGVLGGAGFVLRKVAHAPTPIALRDAAIGATLITAGLGGSRLLSYFKSSDEKKPGFVGPMTTALGIGLTIAGAAGGMMAFQGITPRALAGVGRGAGASAEGLGKGALSQFGKDLTAAARDGEIGRAFGVDAKVDELVSILGAKRKNNPLIVGPAGTGKTALVEELAHRIAAGEVPDHLKGVKIVQIDLDAMVGGTQYRGMFEQRLSSVLKEIQASKGKIIPFIDETHKLVNAGSAREAEGAGEAVKPLLARGKIRLIGATTDAADEIGKIHADPALTRRFTEMTIMEPSADQTLNILRAAAPSFERGGLRFTDDALKGIVELTQPIVGRNQPDKALTLLDTTAARMMIGQESKPAALKALEMRIATAEAELKIVSRESSATSQARSQELSHLLEELRPQASTVHERWSAARTARHDVVTAREALAQTTDPKQVAELNARIKELEANSASHAAAFPEMFATEITRADVGATPLPADAEQQLRLFGGGTHHNPIGFTPGHVTNF